MNPREWLVLRAGPRALSHLRRRDLSPQDIGCVAAAAGGPKGLGLIPLDQRLFGDWLRPARDLELIGASIGAWRMVAAAQADPAAVLQRLADAYVGQTYSARPSPTEVSAECRKLARAVLGPQGRPAFRDETAVNVLTAQAVGALRVRGSRARFARAALANAWSRQGLARHLRRVNFRAAAASAGWLQREFDAFGQCEVALDAGNAEEALLASGSIPLVCDPVRDPPGAPAGLYWDGGLIDYHLLLPYARLDRLVLYPHFVPHLTPGWLDKFLPWRKRSSAHPWLDNVLLVTPSAQLLARLPNGKLPDRQDFYRYGADHAARQRDWRRAIGESERFADAAMHWLHLPDPSIVQPL